MLLVDTVKHKIFEDEELKEYYAKKQPYGEWLDSNLVELHDLKIPNIKVEEFTDEERARLQKAFGYTYEEYRKSILEMALNGGEEPLPWVLIRRWQCFPNSIVPFSTISNSFLPR